MVDQVTQAFHDEQRERKALDYSRKQDFKNAWIEQAIINEKARAVDNLFNWNNKYLFLENIQV